MQAVRQIVQTPPLSKAEQVIWTRQTFPRRPSSILESYLLQAVSAGGCEQTESGAVVLLVLNMAVFALFVISKSGGLIYNREFHAGLQKLGSNDLLMLAGSFHGMHAITKQLCPNPPVPAAPSSAPAANLAPSPFPYRPTGIEVLETSQFRMQCFQTITGIKFLLFTEPQQPNIDTMMKKIYELYADFVMKNPFYTVEMPIRCEKFDRGLDGFIKLRG